MPRPYLTELTETHTKVLRMLAEGYTQEVIAREMHYSAPSAIRYNVRMILEILHASNVTHAVYIATKRGLI